MAREHRRVDLNAAQEESLTSTSPVRVLTSVPFDPSSNPYTEWLYASVGPEIKVDWFTWPRAIFGRYDVFHVHWPEYMFAGSSAIRTILKFALGAVLLLRLWFFHLPVVQTIHTLRPYDGSAWPLRLLTRLLNRVTVFRVYLNESPQNDVSRGCVILLGRYAAPERESEHRRDAHTRLLLFGLLRPYKGITALLDAFRAVDGTDLTLVIAGSPTSEEFKEKLAHVASNDTRVKLRTRRLSDRELHDEVAAADLVVLPYANMYNSSALLLALDHKVPVLATRSLATAAIQQEVGHDWVLLFDAPLDAQTLSEAITALRERGGAPLTPPNLSRREWATIGKLHSALYHLIVETPGQYRRHARWQSYLREQVEADRDFCRHSTLNAGAP
jgi:beta-1,4-mannosyltransferase